MAAAILFPLLLLLLLPLLPGVAAQAAAAPPQPDESPRCVVAGRRNITIACDYTPVSSDRHSTAPRIALDHAELAFETKGDNWMSMALTFTRLDASAVEDRPVYVAIDDDLGHNFIRRPLPAVNLAGLVQGKPTRFEQRLLFPGLQPGHYQITLWIPSNDPAAKFQAGRNLLVSSAGVADPKTGLNKIAAFTVAN